MEESRDAPTDDVLVATYLRDPQGGEGRRALDVLVARWSSHVYRWAFRVVRERDQALDLSQDSVLQMIQALPRYEPRGRFAAWLFVIVHYRCLNAVRRRSIEFDPEVDPDALLGDGTDPAELHESDETRRRVFAAMDAVLDGREKLALWLRAYEGLAIEDITRTLRLDGESGARGLLQTARRKLRAALRANGGEAGA